MPWEICWKATGKYSRQVAKGTDLLLQCDSSDRRIGRIKFGIKEIPGEPEIRPSRGTPFSGKDLRESMIFKIPQFPTRLSS